MPNLQRANVLAVKLLLRQRITSLRTDPLHLDCSGQILVDSVQHYAECVGRSAEDFMAQSSRDCQAYAVYGRYLILYNREVLSSCRRRWSIAHELGHICCRHSCDGVREEAEANAFAASLLMPTAAAGGADTPRQTSGRKGSVRHLRRVPAIWRSCVCSSSSGRERSLLSWRSSCTSVCRSNCALPSQKERTGFNGSVREGV